MIPLADLLTEWTAAKEAERQVTEERRRIEDALSLILGVPESLDGTENFDHCGYTVKVVGRLNRKIDAAKLQEIAAEHGSTEHLSRLFRWKPEIETKVWKATDESITQPLLGAITTTPGRPSYTITKKES